MSERNLKFFEAIREGTFLCLKQDTSVYLIGEGVPDPKGIFGTTLGLQEQFGDNRVMDMPVSENGLTGIAIGSALAGMRPVMTHQRLDFVLLAMEQIVNQAANWHYMFGGQKSIPLVIRLIIGRGWGQGPQHSQSLQNWFAHIPGLKVVMPVTPHDAKGLLIASIEDNNPVLFLEHRWLHNISGAVPQGHYTTSIGKARIARKGNDLTIVAISHMVLEAQRAAEILEAVGVDVEIIDLRSLRPLDTESILTSVRKTGRLLVADTAWKTGGFSGEITAMVAEQAYPDLKAAPLRIALPDCPLPTSHALSKHYYPGVMDIVAAVENMFDVDVKKSEIIKRFTYYSAEYQDIPDSSFTGPF